MLQRKTRTRGVLWKVYKEKKKSILLWSLQKRYFFKSLRNQEREDLHSLPTVPPSSLERKQRLTQLWGWAVCSCSHMGENHHQKAWSRWQARGWGVDCRVSRSNKGEHWLLEPQMCRDEPSLVFTPLCCTSPWDTNTLEGCQPVGGVCWDNNTLRWLTAAWRELPFLFILLLCVMNHLTHQKLGTDCAESEGLMPGCCSGSTGHAGPVGSPAGLLSLLFLPKEGQGKCVTAPSLDSSCKVLECGDRGLTNIQVVIQPQEWKWEEGRQTQTQI